MAERIARRLLHLLEVIESEREAENEVDHKQCVEKKCRDMTVSEDESKTISFRRLACERLHEMLLLDKQQTS